MKSSSKNISRNIVCYVDVAFPLAVREVFTYAVPASVYSELLKPGIRVWVPLRNTMSIGMVVKLHRNKPTYETELVRRVLDESPVLDPAMLQLCEWMHRFYYAAFGEVIQAALPSGFNFSSVKYVLPGQTPADLKPGTQEFQLFEAVRDAGKLPYSELQKRWGETSSRTISRLVKKQVIEVWETPELKVKPKTELTWELCVQDRSNHPPKNSSKKWEQAFEILKGMDIFPASNAALTSIPEVTPYIIRKLEQEGLLIKGEREITSPEPDYPFEPDSLFPLNEEQLAVFEKVKAKIDAKTYHSFLLYGVTGSGKTEVYIHALREVIAQNRGALILVPEIALTPQTVRRFYRIFGDKIAILHSRLNDRERFDAWDALRSGRKTIAIGARSAVFAPVQNLGLIIIDEEHDTSYRQADPAPRYHAREVAAMRASVSGAVVILGSATPSLVSLVNASKGKHTMIRLENRHTGSTMPEVRILDMKQYRSAMRGPLAIPLYEAICEAVAGGEQVILLYNRRGFASFLQCQDCGHVSECPDCSVTMTYHKFLNQIRCHYCGLSERVTPHCKSCGSPSMNPVGSGTQQVEEDLETILPDIRILRMDQDTTSRKNAHDQILSAFGRGEADVLVGTQLVAKGLDFPNVTVVGVINADTELAFPSYRSHERMYQLLSQVAGRSGRALKKGKVFLQTRQANHFTLRYAREHDFEGFARHELEIRKPLLYPPYGRLLTFSFKGKDPQLTAKVAQVFTQCVEHINTGYPVLGPSPEAILKIRNEYRWCSTMKLPAESKTGLVEQIADRAFELYKDQKPPKSGSVRITVSHEMI